MYLSWIVILDVSTVRRSAWSFYTLKIVLPTALIYLFSFIAFKMEIKAIRVGNTWCYPALFFFMVTTFFAKKSRKTL